MQTVPGCRQLTCTILTEVGSEGVHSFHTVSYVDGIEMYTVFACCPESIMPRHGLSRLRVQIYIKGVAKRSGGGYSPLPESHPSLFHTMGYCPILFLFIYQISSRIQTILVYDERPHPRVKPGIIYLHRAGPSPPFELNYKQRFPPPLSVKNEIGHCFALLQAIPHFFPLPSFPSPTNRHTRRCAPFCADHPSQTQYPSAALPIVNRHQRCGPLSVVYVSPFRACLNHLICFGVLWI